MKRFRISLPAHIVIEIDARNTADAVQQAKDMAGFEYAGIVHGIAGHPVLNTSLGKFVLGSDSVEEVAR